jgi:hypothetical protein
MPAVINRFHLVAVQELSQLAGVVAIIPVSLFSQVVLARIRYHHTGDMRLEQIVQLASPGAFFKGHMHTAAQPVHTLQNRLVVVGLVLGMVLWLAPGAKSQEAPKVHKMEIAGYFLLFRSRPR